MELYLMQHGTPFSREIDPERKLSPVGRDVIMHGAEAIRKMGLGFDAIISATEASSVQTARIVAAPQRYPANRIVKSEQFNSQGPAEGAIEFLKGFAEQEAVFVAGPQSTLADIASLLIGREGGVAIQLDNGALMRIDLADIAPGGGVLRWFLSAYHLQIIAAS